MNKGFLARALTIFALTSNGFAYASCDDTVLHDYMHDIRNELKSMADEVKAGNNGEATKYADALIATFQKARMEQPYQFSQENLKGDELATQTQAYHKVIDDTIDILNTLEAALKANDSDQIKNLLAAMGQQRKLGHKAFKQNC